MDVPAVWALVYDVVRVLMARGPYVNREKVFMEKLRAEIELAAAEPPLTGPWPTKARAKELAFIARTGKPLPQVAIEPAHERRRRSPSRRDSRLKQWGMSDQVFDLLLEAQNGCAICHTWAPVGAGRGWVVDHDHATGNIRGILCARCNSGIGFLQDSLEVCESAVRYLSKRTRAPDRQAR